MPKYQVIPSRHWKHADGRTASVYGAAPYVSDADRAAWTIVNAGWTVENTRTGTVGIGRRPWTDKARAEAWAAAASVNDHDTARLYLPE